MSWPLEWGKNLVAVFPYYISMHQKLPHFNHNWYISTSSIFKQTDSNDVNATKTV